MDSQSSIGLFDIGRVFLEGREWGDFPGLCKKTPARNHPLVWYGTTWDSRRAYLSFSTFVGTGLSWFYFVFVDDGSDWSTMDSVGLDLILHCWSAGTSCARVSGRGLLLHESPTSHQALRWTISFYHQQHLAWSSRASGSSRTVEWFGLPRSRLPCNALFMTLVSSVDLIDGEPSASLAWYAGTFSVGRGSRLSGRSLFGGDIRLGSLGLGKGP